MCAFNENEFIFTHRKFPCDKDLEKLIIKNNKIVSDEFKDLQYILLILVTILESIFEYEEERS